MLRLLKCLILALGVAAIGAPMSAQAPPVNVAPSAPRDRPFTLSDTTSMAGLHRFLEPCRLRALEEFPAVKQRFHKGLPPQQSLFVVTRLRDSQARMEQVFVAVDSLRTDRIVGRIWSDIHSVSGYQMRQPIEFAESEIVDWMISKPDGSEEGNRMGKLIDELQLKGSLPPDACAR